MPGGDPLAGIGMPSGALSQLALVKCNVNVCAAKSFVSGSKVDVCLKVRVGPPPFIYCLPSRFPEQYAAGSSGRFKISLPQI
jgi:hypothetical protein